MIYPYRGKTCGHTWDVIKAIAEIDRPEACPTCHATDSERYIARTHFYGASDWDKAEFNPAFGQVVRNAQHRRELARQRGMEEIGNEPVENIHKHFEAQKREQLAATWKDPMA